jgi:hypothetical protein
MGMDLDLKELPRLRRAEDEMGDLHERVLKR